MARKSNNDMIILKKTIADILLNRLDDVSHKDGSVNICKLEKLLKDDYSIDVSRPTLIKLLDAETKEITSEYLQNSQDSILKEIDDDRNLLKNMLNAETDNSERRRLIETRNKVRENQTKILKFLSDAQRIVKEFSQAKYTIVFGEPEVIKENNTLEVIDIDEMKKKGEEDESKQD